MVRFCNKCKRAVDDLDKFCRSCGHGTEDSVDYHTYYRLPIKDENDQLLWFMKGVDIAFRQEIKGINEKVDRMYQRLFPPSVRELREEFGRIFDKEEEPVEKPPEVKVDKPLEKKEEPVDKPLEKKEEPVDKPPEVKVDKPLEKKEEPVDKPLEKKEEPVDKPPEVKVDKPLEKKEEPVDKPPEVEVDKPLEKKEEPVDKPPEVEVDKPLEKKEEPVDKPPEVEVEKPPEVEVEKPPEVEVEKPPEVEVEKPPEVEVGKKEEKIEEKPAEILPEIDVEKKEDKEDWPPQEEGTGEEISKKQGEIEVHEEVDDKLGMLLQEDEGQRQAVQYLINRYSKKNKGTNVGDNVNNKSGDKPSVDKGTSPSIAIVPQEDVVRIGRARGKGKEKGEPYKMYDVAIHPFIPDILKSIKSSNDGMIRVRLLDIAKKMGEKFVDKKPVTIYGGLKYTLFDHNIVVEMGSLKEDDPVTKESVKILKMRMRNSDDTLPPSLLERRGEIE